MIVRLALEYTFITLPYLNFIPQALSVKTDTFPFVILSSPCISNSNYICIYKIIHMHMNVCMYTTSPFKLLKLNQQSIHNNKDGASKQ